MHVGIILVFVQIITASLSFDQGNEGIKKQVQNETEEKFEYFRTEPGNELGIFAKIIAHVFRKANQTIEEFHINRAYLPDDVYESLLSQCDNKDSILQWHDCIGDEKGFFGHTNWGIPELKNKTITYLELEFKPYIKLNEKGVEEMCIMEELYTSRAYVVLNTFSEIPSNDSFPRGVIESVAHVHQHQLDSFGENFLSIFGDKIDPTDIYNFGQDEYYDRDPPYECLLSIASSESTSVIEERCDIFCQDASEVSKEEMEDVLIQAKRVALEHEKKESKRVPLTVRKRDEF